MRRPSALPRPTQVAVAISRRFASACDHTFVTAQGHARTRYRRAIERKHLMGAEMALREMGAVDLLEALDYVALLADLRQARAPRAAVRWHGRLETEAPMLTLPESALALAALVALGEGGREAGGLVRRPRRTRPTSEPASV